MSDISKRPGAQTTSAPAEKEPFALLTTARDNAEAAFIESVLRGEDIPYVTRPHSPERLLDDAAALLAPADGEDGQDTDGENK